MKQLVAGQERIYLDRFWNESLATPSKFSEGSRNHFAQIYAVPGAMHTGFAQFAAFDQDAIDYKACVASGKLTMPILAIDGEKPFGPMMATVMRFAGTDVTEGIVPGAGHWLMEEQPDATVKLVRELLPATRRKGAFPAPLPFRSSC